MAHKVRWTRLALGDLVEIRAFIAADSASAADAFIDKVRGAVERLVEFPESGRVVPERSAQGYREVIVAPYRMGAAPLGRHG